MPSQANRVQFSLTAMIRPSRSRTATSLKSDARIADFISSLARRAFSLRFRASALARTSAASRSRCTSASGQAPSMPTRPNVRPPRTRSPATSGIVRSDSSPGAAPAGERTTSGS